MEREIQKLQETKVRREKQVPLLRMPAIWRRTSLQKRWRRNSQGGRRKQDRPGREYPTVLTAKESEDPGKFRYVGEVEIHGNRGECYLVEHYYHLLKNLDFILRA